MSEPVAPAVTTGQSRARRPYWAAAGLVLGIGACLMDIRVAFALGRFQSNWASDPAQAWDDWSAIGLALPALLVAFVGGVIAIVRLALSRDGRHGFALSVAAFITSAIGVVCSTVSLFIMGISLLIFGWSADVVS